MPLTAAQQITQIYVGYYNRAPDAAGLNYWVGRYNAGMSYAQIAQSFSVQTESTNTYAYLANPNVASVTTFLTAVYTNLFNRAPDTAGAAYWSAQINSGASTVGNAIMNIISGAYGAGANAQDKVVLENKMAAGLNWAQTMANINGAVYGTAEAASAAAIIASVTSDAATVTAANTATSSFFAAGGGAPGTTYTLTIGADSGSAFIGGSGNDTFNAAETTAATWSVGDAIDGGAGTDTFNITQTAAITAPTGATVKNVEKANLVSGTSGTSLNSTSWSGLTALDITAPGAVTATAAATTNVTITDATQGASAISVDGGKAVSVTGSTSVASAATGGTVTVGATTAAAGAVSVTENVKSTNVTDTTAATGGAIAVTGGSSVTVTQNISGASVATKNVTVNAVGGAVTVTGDANTTSATVNQTAAVVAVASATVGVHGIKAGAVTINDVNAGSTTAAGVITTATLKNYGDSTINSNALTTVNLEGTGGTLGITTNSLTTAANTTLALNVNGLSYKNAGTNNAITIDSDVTTLNIKSSTAASTVNNITASGATAVNVSGDAALTLTDNTFAAATAITVTNTAGASFKTTAIAAGTLFTGGAGADSIILSDSFTKAITMGDGNDTVTVGGTTIGTGGSVAAGSGTDTIRMTSAQAATFDNDATFNTKFTGFEVLELSNALAAGTTLDLAGLNSVSKVVLAAGGGHASTAIISNLVSGGTVQTNASSTGVTVNVANATFNAADILNLGIYSATAATTGAFTAAGVETLNITVGDATSTGGDAVKHVITKLAVADATTINVSGNNGLTITAATGSTAVTTFDASGVVANSSGDTAANLAVTYTSLNSTTSASVKITGGAGNDVLTGNAAKDTIIGGAGADQIDGKAGIDTLTGGAGVDTFTIGAGEAGITGAESITDFAIGVSGDNLNLATTTLLADQTATVVTSAVSGAVDVTATVATGIITIGGADAALVDTLGELKAIFELLDTDNTAEVGAIVLNGVTYVITDAASGGGADTVNDIIKLVGVTSATSLATTSAAGTILIS